MNQSSIIASALILLFIFYITVKGELATYIDFFIPAAEPSTSALQSAGAPASSAGSPNSPPTGGTVYQTGIPGVIIQGGLLGNFLDFSAATKANVQWFSDAIGLPKGPQGD